jgi:DNA adenine methylase
MATRALARRTRVDDRPVRAAPIVKWAGGKGRLFAQLEPLLPPGLDARRYVEPFMGGGALFFALAPQKALVSDVNPALVRTYEAVRDEVDAVIAHLRKLARRHDQLAYYATRERYNKAVLSDAEHAATFIYLNKTCFNGLHRVNRRGEFNVPFGRYTDPRILDEEGLRASSHALSKAEIRVAGFEHLLESARPGDFVYFDPPYAPVSSTANFTSYASGGFDHSAQTRLRDVYRELDRRGCRLMLSNSDVPSIRELYEAFRIDVVYAARAINCDASGRARVPEVVVRNY